MKFTERLKSLIRRGRLKKALSVNLRWALRRVRRFFQRDQFRRGIKGAYAKRLYAMLGLLLGVTALTVASAALCGSWLADEAVLVRRLSDPDYERSNPILCALDQFGSSNRIQVTLRTETRDNLHPQKVDLDRGSLNLVMTLKNGSIMEYTLQNRNIDNFESGNTDQFTLILPDSISVFDITDYELVLLPDAKGEYGSWYCRWAQISFLLGGERTLLAEDPWRETFAFSANQRSSSLEPVASDNAYYAQVSQLFPYVLEVCKNGHETVHTKEIKEEALETLGLSDGTVLYLDVETVGLENQHTMIRDQLGGMELSEYDQMDYDGTMTLRVRFYSDAGGSYYKDYDLDTPGKDDFELGNTSTFALNMPEGMTAFDILSMELLVHDNEDVWAPRMIRAYLRTDFGMALELARVTDTSLLAERRTAVFYQGLIDTSISPLRLALTESHQLPLALREQVQEKFYTEIKGVTYSMYFNEFNFYERQKLFYSQIMALMAHGGTDEKA
ncbi:MAG: hypothetical protein IJP27_02765 [Clostridia bacterium]|nr:hypothetical protein [Clostridia bacterium]